MEHMNDPHGQCGMATLSRKNFGTSTRNAKIAKIWYFKNNPNTVSLDLQGNLTFSNYYALLLTLITITYREDEVAGADSDSGLGSTRILLKSSCK